MQEKAMLLANQVATCKVGLNSLLHLKSYHWSFIFAKALLTKFQKKISFSVVALKKFNREEKRARMAVRFV